MSASAKSNPWKTATLVLGGVILGLVIALPIGSNSDFFGSLFRADPQKKALNEYVKSHQDDWKFYETASGKTDDGFPSLGQKTAPITMSEYSDFQCPFCKAFFENTLASIKENYVKTGQVYFVYKDFPIVSRHPNAISAAQAAHCAGEQGKYFQMHDLIFSFVDFWAEEKDPTRVFEKFSKALGLKKGDFSKCYKDFKYQELTKKGWMEAEKAELTGTPGFVVTALGFSSDAKSNADAQTFTGAQPLNYFEQLFATLLTEKSSSDANSDSKMEKSDAGK